MVCFALELVGSWVELGFSVKYGGFGVSSSINVPWNQEFSGVLSGVLSGFQSYSYTSLKTSPPIQHR